MARADTLSKAVPLARPDLRPPGGFSLVELLMVVTLVGILAAVAIPSYNAYIVRSQRSAAKATLSQAAQWLERNYTSNGCYNFTSPAGCQTGAGSAVTVTSLGGLASVPSDGSAHTYTVALSFTSAVSGVQDYSLTATPCGETTCAAPSNATFDDPDCGALTLNNAGVKDAGGTFGSAGTPEKCWGR
jgi:type IV pilus assembly protein PilE